LDRFVLAQLTPQTPAFDPFAVAKIAMRRWFSGVTLSSPEAIPSNVPLSALLLGCLALLCLVVIVQRPTAALRQLIDLPGHFRVLRGSINRLRRAGRLIAALLGASVLSWTVWQSRFFASSDRLEDLANLLKRKSPGEVAAEQGLLAAITPLRDLCGLSNNMVLLLAACALVFKVSANGWSSLDTARDDSARRVPPWATAAWASAWVFGLYRLACHVWQANGLPLGQLPWVEVVLLPPAMLICDALLFSWTLNELRLAQTDSESSLLQDSALQAVTRLPYAMIGCLLLLPARYAATTAWLAVRSLPTSAPSSIRWLLATALFDWGLVWLQAASIALLPLVAACAWARDRGGFWRVLFRVLRSGGARIFVLSTSLLVALAGLSSLAYLALLSLPAQPWVLAAADSYAHYLTLPLGLLLAASIVEIGDSTLERQPRSPQQEGSEPSIIESETILALHG
jgi:hypothetical protein